MNAEEQKASKVQVWAQLKYFSRALRHVAAVMEYGASKQGRYPGSWIEQSEGKDEYFTSALVRHMLDIETDDIVDDESGFLHKAHIACNALMDLEMYVRDMDSVSDKLLSAEDELFEKPPYTDEYLTIDPAPAQRFPLRDFHDAETTQQDFRYRQDQDELVAAAFKPFADQGINYTSDVLKNTGHPGLRNDFRNSPAYDNTVDKEPTYNEKPVIDTGSMCRDRCVYCMDTD